MQYDGLSVGEKGATMEGNTESLGGESSDMESEHSYNEGYDDSDYYNCVDDIDTEDKKQTDPEYFEFECLTEEQVERVLNETVEVLSNNLQITPALAKVKTAVCQRPTTLTHHLVVLVSFVVYKILCNMT